MLALDTQKVSSPEEAPPASPAGAPCMSSCQGRVGAGWVAATSSSSPESLEGTRGRPSPPQFDREKLESLAVLSESEPHPCCCALPCLPGFAPVRGVPSATPLCQVAPAVAPKLQRIESHSQMPAPPGARQAPLQRRTRGAAGAPPRRQPPAGPRPPSAGRLWSGPTPAGRVSRRVRLTPASTSAPSGTPAGPTAGCAVPPMRHGPAMQRPEVHADAATLCPPSCTLHWATCRIVALHFWWLAFSPGGIGVAAGWCVRAARPPGVWTRPGRCAAPPPSV